MDDPAANLQVANIDMTISSLAAFSDTLELLDAYMQYLNESRSQVQPWQKLYQNQDDMWS